MPRWARARIGLTLALALACTPEPEPPLAGQLAEQPEAAACPRSPIAQTRAPDVLPSMETAEFWLAKLAPGQADAPLVGPAEHEQIAARSQATPGAWRDPLDPALADPAHVQAELDERLAWLRERVASGKYLEGRPEALERAASIVAQAAAVDEAQAIHRIVEETPLWCLPTREGLYTPPSDREFDRNQCASLHLGELVRVLRRTDTWAYVDAGQGVGWIALDDAAPLGPTLTPEQVRAEREGPGAWVIDDWSVPTLGGTSLRAGTRFARRDDALVVPTAAGEQLVPFDAQAPLAPAPLALTRRTLFDQAFAQLGDPYGWGGRAGRRDCSSLMLDLFAQFDVQLGRNSAVQSQQGVHAIELRGQDDAAKRAAIRNAAERGVVLLYMPGHIMLYLGHHELDEVEHDYAISAISEFLVPCPGGPDTVHRLDRVAVTTLELGRGSERGAYLERIERLALFAPM